MKYEKVTASGNTSAASGAGSKANSRSGESFSTNVVKEVKSSARASHASNPPEISKGSSPKPTSGSSGSNSDKSSGATFVKISPPSKSSSGGSSLETAKT